jgi:hypothetical protein
VSAPRFSWASNRTSLMSPPMPSSPACLDSMCFTLFSTNPDNNAATDVGRAAWVARDADVPTLLRALERDAITSLAGPCAQSRVKIYDPAHAWRNNWRGDNDGIVRCVTRAPWPQPPYGLRCAPSAKGGSFARRGLPASATSTHRPLPQPETKGRQRSRQQGRRRAELGSNAARCPRSFPYS